MAVPQVLIMMADSGHDPTETAVPYAIFKDAGFNVQFATENGNAPVCDKRMIEGITGKLLGSKRSAIELYQKMQSSPECQKPLSWTTASFSLDSFQLVVLPGGHEKGIRQIVDSPKVHSLLVDYLPTTRKPSKRAIGAICHGVMVLAASKDENGKSAISECETTTLPGAFESSVFWATRLFLGDYYKTYGAGSENVEDFVRRSLSDDQKQFKSNIYPSPFVVVDKQYNYVSARFPPDAELFAETLVDIVKKSQS